MIYNCATVKAKKRSQQLNRSGFTGDLHLNSRSISTGVIWPQRGMNEAAGARRTLLPNHKSSSESIHSKSMLVKMEATKK